jgi:hypothetical protein
MLNNIREIIIPLKPSANVLSLIIVEMGDTRIGGLNRVVGGLDGLLVAFPPKLVLIICFPE